MFPALTLLASEQDPGVRAGKEKGARGDGEGRGTSWKRTGGNINVWCVVRDVNPPPRPSTTPSVNDSRLRRTIRERARTGPTRGGVC